MGRKHTPVFFEAQKAEELIRSASGSSKAAEDLLLMAAHYMRNGEPLPRVLGQYLADVLETAVNTPERLDPHAKGTGAALLIGLNLKALNARSTGVDPYAVCAFLYREVYGRSDDDPPPSLAKAVRCAARHFGISESTVKRYYRDRFNSFVTDCLTAYADPPDATEIELLSKGG